MTDYIMTTLAHGLELISAVFVVLVGLGVVAVVIMYVLDSTQSRDAVRHNFPVIGRLRYAFTRLGEFFRQYFFALDREEMPFNRAQREWIYRSSMGKDNTVAFGSTLSLTPVGTPIFINDEFPTLEDQASDPPAVIFGPDCEHPYECKSIINISGMSFGALSRPAVRALARGAAKAGCYINTGEGGLSPYHLEGGPDVVIQIGTAKYGYRDAAGNFSFDILKQKAANPQVKMIELKLSQGAKPGKGGLLPADKVTAEIAEIRNIPEGVASVSPNRHVEVDSASELLDFINQIRDASGKPTGFKTAVGAYEWLEDLCKEIVKRGAKAAPDFITIDGGEGGTGAAPMPLIDNVGLSIRESLPIVIDILSVAGLRDRIKVIASGKLVTPADVAWAYCAGADTVNSARGFMFSIGCIQAMRCNRNTCPTGITTHKKHLQDGLNPEEKSVRVQHFVEKMHKGVGIIAHSCGVPHARALNRHHVRIVQPNGYSVPLAELFPQQGQVS